MLAHEKGIHVPWIRIHGERVVAILLVVYLHTNYWAILHRPYSFNHLFRSREHFWFGWRSCWCFRFLNAQSLGCSCATGSPFSAANSEVLGFARTWVKLLPENQEQGEISMIPDGLKRRVFSRVPNGAVTYNASGVIESLQDFTGVETEEFFF